MNTHPDRFEQLRKAFNEGAELTLEQMQERLGLRSERQVRRLIDRLRAEGVNVQERKEGRMKVFFLPEGEREVEVPMADGIAFEERELFALTVAAQAALSSLAPTPLGTPMQSAYEKLLDGMDGRVYTFEPEYQREHWHFGATAHSNIDPELFEKITKAINESESIRIEYFSASSGRHWPGRLVDPYIIAVRGSSWLVVAWCHETRQIVDLSLPGIQQVTPAGQTFIVKAGFDPDLHFRDRFNVLRGDQEWRVCLQVEPRKVEYFRRKTYHPTQQIEKIDADGSALVSIRVSGLDEISSFIRSWGPGVLVVEPEELAARIAAEAAAVARAYAERPKAALPAD